MDKDQANTGAAGQQSRAKQDSKAAQGGLWQYEVPPQDPGAGAGQSNSAHYTGGAHGGDSQQGDFLASSLEQNALPAGAPQTSRGSAGKGGADPQTRPMAGAGGGSGGGGLVPEGGATGGSAGAGPVPDGGAAGGGGDGNDGAGAGGGQPAPVGNGTRDQPVWAT